jgi:putative transposase
VCYTYDVKLVAKVKVVPTAEQRQLLKDTLYQANSAANEVSGVAWEAKCFRPFAIHKLVYEEVRQRYGLSAQMTVRVIGKVADAYKAGKKRERKFKKLGAIAYDSRILSWQMEEQRISIWAMGGRQRMRYQGGERQLELLENQLGETDLAYRGGEFYLLATCEVEEPEVKDVTGYLGVDLGIVNLATDSDEHVYAGGQVNGLRRRHAKLRSRLQSRGTKSARRLLRKRSRKEQRFAADVNHCIAKELVERAERTGQGVAIEDLTGIRERVRVRKAQRRQHSAWAFDDLRKKIAYKARLLGIPVIAVNPRNTSRTCHECGHCEKGNRQSQERFECQSCGHVSNADYNAACNIAGRAADALASIVNQPNVSATALPC